MADSRALYLDLMKRALTNVIYQDPAQPPTWYRGADYDEQRHRNGKDWPSAAHTMVRNRRLDNPAYESVGVGQSGVP